MARHNATAANRILRSLRRTRRAKFLDSALGIWSGNFARERVRYLSTKLGFLNKAGRLNPWPKRVCAPHGQRGSSRAVFGPVLAQRIRRGGLGSTVARHTRVFFFRRVVSIT